MIAVKNLDLKPFFLGTKPNRALPHIPAPIAVPARKAGAARLFPGGSRIRLNGTLRIAVVEHDKSFRLKMPEAMENIPQRLIKNMQAVHKRDSDAPASQKAGAALKKSVARKTAINFFPAVGKNLSAPIAAPAGESRINGDFLTSAHRPEAYALIVADLKINAARAIQKRLNDFFFFQEVSPSGIRLISERTRCRAIWPVRARSADPAESPSPAPDKKAARCLR